MQLYPDIETESDYNLYATQLAALGYGIPLWQPAPLSDYKRVRIADVGYIRTGQFYRLFNASLPSDDPAQCRGVPENYLPLDEITSERKQFRMPGVLHTRDVRLEGVELNMDANDAWTEHERPICFVSSSGQGAILATKDVTLREDAVQLGFLKTYMAGNCESWLEMANTSLGCGIRLDDLILVTGCDLTTESAMSTFVGGGSDFAITFKPTCFSTESSSPPTWGEWHTSSTAALFKNFGSSNLISGTQPLAVEEHLPRPAIDHPEFNQCVFLRGFRVRRRGALTSTVTNIPTTFPLRDDDENASHLRRLHQSDMTDGGGSIAVEPVADKNPFVDPLEPHFEHIFESTGAQKVLAHDKDFYTSVNSDTVGDEINSEEVPSPKFAMTDNEVLHVDPTEAPRSPDLNPLNTSESQPFIASPPVEPADWTFPPVPAEVKGVTAYLQRAQELKVKNPVIAYWCTYFATKKVISSTVQNEEIRIFLGDVMSVLEWMKSNLSDHDAILHEVASVKYIKNFALRVFRKADSEDRKQKANRSTAKKYLASATFFELLRLFEQTIEPGLEEKIHYAKWKAADIAKAFREGRTPLPGNLHAPSHLSSVGSMATPAVSEMLDLPQENMSTWSPSPSVGFSLAPSPAIQGFKSLESSPVTKLDALIAIPESRNNDEEKDVSRPPTPTTSSPPFALAPSPSPPFNPQLSSLIDQNLDETDDVQTEAIPEAVEDVGGSIWNSKPSDEQREGEPEELDKDDEWSTLGMQSISRQGSWTLPEDASIIPEDAPLSLSVPNLGFLPEPPSMAIIKRVRFSPSVVGGLSSASSSVAASSPPASPERFAPSLPTVLEATYSSDSDREGKHSISAERTPPDPASIPLPESIISSSESSVSDSDDSDGWTHGVPPVITKVPSPSSPPSPKNDSSIKAFPQAPSLQLTAPSPQFHPRYMAGFSPHPSILPALHPSPRLFPHTLALYSNNNVPSSPSDGSTSPDLGDTQASQAQGHCRSAISALDYEDANSARDEILAALAKIGE